jgi:hypothetical protein
MPISKTIDFLPPYLRTRPNKRFLDSTLDVLTSPPQLSRFNGYIGRQWKNGTLLDGSYLLESTAPRQNYQLESAFVTTDDQNNITNISNFIDVLNATSNKDGIVSDWARILTSGMYSWKGFVDIDKLINYQNYYWLYQPVDNIQSVNAWYWNNSIEINDSINNVQGHISYITSDNITLLDGMIVSIANVSYIVEGVGKEIVLIPLTNILTPSFAADQNNPPDYLTINRSAPDLNLWSRSNLWVHKDTVNAIISALSLENTPQSFIAANRPIIEFIPLVLFDQGRIGLSPVTYVDFYTPNAFSIVQGAASFSYNGTSLKSGDSVIFAGDKNSNVRATLYTVNFIDPNNTNNFVIHLSPSQVAVENNCTLVTSSNETIIFDGSNWAVSSQNKTGINQAPLFDVFDLNGNSLANVSFYPDSDFAGSSLFSYEIGVGLNDSVLGFPLSYGPIGNLNDVIFTNNYVSDTFSYLTTGTNPQSIIIGRAHQIDSISHDESIYDAWQYVNGDRQLYQNTVAFGSNIIRMVGTLLNGLSPQIFVDGTKLSADQFTVVQLGEKIVVTIKFDLISVNSVVFLKIQSATPITNAWYDVPSAFSNNPLGQSLPVLTMSNIRDHATTSQVNANDSSRIIDLQLNSYQGVAGSMLYQESLPILPALLLTNPQFDIDQAIRSAGEDYISFKQKLINTFSQISNAQNLSSKQVVDTALQTIASIYTSGQPWASSDMCYWGGKQTSITVSNVRAVTFNLTQVYNWNASNYQSLQVYINGTQLTYGIDYKTTDNILTILRTLNLKDLINIYEISNTSGSFIPATPTKLGLAAAFIPQMYIDYTYQTPRKVIQGHDGSITECFNDYRDNLLLDYELRVYNNLKVNNQQWVDIIETRVHQTSKFATGVYSEAEQLNISQRMFYEWTAQYNISSDNNFYDENNLFTWNWNSSLDKFGQPLLGYWRGIYDWFYNSENVNTRPWEMLNLSIKPSWWDATYGPAPYTGENNVMWNDIANGIIRNPNGISLSSYGTRVGMLDVIPVNENGILLNPNEAVVGTFNNSSSPDGFIYGDCGPVETAWKRSSIYPFSRLRALILQNPLFMLGTTWDMNNYTPTNGAYQFKFQNNFFASNNQIIINSVDATPVNSIVNYSVEYIRRNGQDPSILRTTLNSTFVELAYSMAGFTDVQNLSVFASPNNPADVGAEEMIPDADYSLFLNTSTPVGTINYSGVIISIAGNNTGYKITGYNRNNPYFTIYAAATTAASIPLGVGNNNFTYPAIFSSKTTIIPYNTTLPDQQSVINFLAGYGQFLLTNGISFNVNIDQDKIDWSNAALQFVKWSLVNWGSNDLSLVLNPSSAIIEYTATSGTLYDLSDPLSSLVLDVNGNSVDPKYFDVYRTGNTVSITNQDGSVFACIAANIVNYEHRFVINNVSEFNDIIYDPVTGSRQNRLLISGQKTANWTGSLDIPGFILTTNQVDSWIPNKDYLLGAVVKWKNFNYIANSDIIGAASFQYSQFKRISTTFTNQLLPNLSLKAVDLSNAYNINYRPYLTDLVTLRNNTIGYVERDWLSSLGIDPAGQTNFYRGWIKEKGTVNALNSYGRGSTSKFNTQVSLNEEYAMKVGEYGATARTGYGDVSLPPSTNTQNPLVISFVSTPDINDTSTIQVTPFNLYEKSTNWQNDFIQNYGNLKLTNPKFIDGGPILPENIISQAYQKIPEFIESDEASLFFANISTMMQSTSQDNILKIAENQGSFWIESNTLADGPNQWDVITFTGANTKINSITQLTSNSISFGISTDIGVVKNDVIIIDHSDTNSNISIRGTFKILDYYIAPTANSYANLTIVGNFANSNISNISYVPAWDELSIWTNRSLRGKSIAESNISAVDDHIYVTTDSFGEAAYTLITPYATEIAYEDVINQDLVASLFYDSASQMIWSGKPSSADGFGEVEIRVLSQTITSNNIALPALDSKIYAIEPLNPTTFNLGRKVICHQGIGAISATTRYNNILTNIGQVYITQLNDLNVPIVTQILSGDGVTMPTLNNSNFGYNFAMSDNNWLYVSIQSMTAAGFAGIAVYSLQTVPLLSYSVLSTTSNSITVNNSILDEYSIKIVLNYPNAIPNILVPGIDYSISSGNVINIINPNIIISDSDIVSVSGLTKYYKFQGSLIDPTGQNSGFGTSMACDAAGEIIAVGVPQFNSNFGGIIIFNRVIEKTYKAAATANITTINPFSSISSITVNGQLLSPSKYSYPSDNPTNISFSPNLLAGSVIQIEGFCFALSQFIQPPNGTDYYFGMSLDVQNNQLIVGSPGSNNNTGAIYLYSLDTQLASTKSIPLSDLVLNTPSFNVNDWVITRSGTDALTLVNDINSLSNYSGITASIANNNLILFIDQTLQSTGITNFPYTWTNTEITFTPPAITGNIFRDRPPTSIFQALWSLKNSGGDLGNISPIIPPGIHHFSPMTTTAPLRGII